MTSEERIEVLESKNKDLEKQIILLEKILELYDYIHNCEEEEPTPPVTNQPPWQLPTYPWTTPGVTPYLPNILTPVITCGGAVIKGKSDGTWDLESTDGVSRMITYNTSGEVSVYECPESIKETVNIYSLPKWGNND